MMKSRNPSALNRKKVLMISGSPRKKNTWNALLSVAAVLEKQGAEVELLRITDYTIQDCLGCESCVKGRSCPLDDDIPLLLEKLKQSDAIVLASPVYMCQVSGQLKRFLDRTPHWFHRPELTGKPSFALVTTAGSYQKETLNYLSSVLMHWGTLLAGRTYRNAKTWNHPVIESELTSFVSILEQGASAFKPGLRNLILFNVQKVLSEKILPVDRQFWEEKGWLRAPFFVEARIGWSKRFFAILFYRMLKSRVQPYREPADS